MGVTRHGVIRIFLGDENAHTVIAKASREGVHVLLGDIEDVVIQEHKPLPPEHPGENQPQVALCAEVASQAPARGREILSRRGDEGDPQRISRVRAQV